MTDNTTGRQDQIGQVAESFVSRFRAGERPSIEEYAGKYPKLADELRKLLPALVMLEQHGSVDGASSADQQQHWSRPMPREIGEFTIIREIGRGGMGVVYEAVQQSLGRHVALKVLSSGSLLNPTHLERFRLEARSAGRLHHSHIVPVFGVGESDGLHYYAMQFIAGQSLDQVIEALRRVRPNRGEDVTAPPAIDELAQSIADGLLSGGFALNGSAAVGGSVDPFPAKEDVESENPSSAVHSSTSTSIVARSEFSSGSSGRRFYESVARVGLQVAEALSYAHSEGILHRDIKPSNLLLDAKGDTWVADFGLAKADESRALTETGDFVGTLRYMAPERLEGWSDRRSDVYGLGATLYELLTLHMFFEKASRGQLVEHVRHKQPEAPTKIDPAVPRDLETIVLKALSKEPGSRYHTADEMAEDLRRFLADRPILARRATTTERFVRWCRRNPLVASLTATVAVLLMTTVGILAISNVQIRQESQAKAAALSERNEALATATEQGSLAERRLYAAQMNLAIHAVKSSDWPRVASLLESVRPTNDELDLRGFEWHYLQRLCRPALRRQWWADESFIHQIAFSPRSHMLAVPSHMGAPIKLWDVRNGAHLGDLPCNFGVRGLAFSPDGEKLAAAASNYQGEGKLLVWSIGTRELLWQNSSRPESVAYTPDGSVLASSQQADATDAGQIHFWRADDGQLLTSLKGHDAEASRFVFSPDGRSLAAAVPPWWPERAGVILWELNGLSATKRWKLNEIGALGFAFSQDGRSLYAGDRDFNKESVACVRVIDVASGTVRDELIGHTDFVTGICPLGDGRRLVTAAKDRTLRLWDLSSRTSKVVGAELAAIEALALSSDEREIICANAMGLVSVHNLDDLQDPPKFQGSRGINGVMFAPDGRSLIVAGTSLQVLDSATLQVRAARSADAAAISKDAHVAAVRAGDKYQAFDIKSLELGPAFETGSETHAHLAPDGKYLATYAPWRHPILSIWNTTTGTLYERYHSPMVSVVDVAFSPSTRQMAAAVQFCEIATLDLDRRQWRTHSIGQGHDCASAVEYGPQGNCLAVGMMDGDILLLDVQAKSGDLVLRSRWNGHRQIIVDIEFSPDGKSVVSAGSDNAVRFWDATTGQERITLDLSVKLLAFSPDGSRLAVVENDDTIRVLNGGERDSWHP